VIGGGIVGIPFAMLHTGIPLGIALNVVIMLAAIYTGSLFFKAKHLSPCHVGSLYELGYVTMGRKSIYLISLLLVFIGTGCIIIYFIVFSRIAASLAQDILGEENKNILCDRRLYVLVLALLMLPLALKKKLDEMKVVSISLFVAIALFISLSAI